MSEIQVEVCFTDKLESVRVGGKKMEIPKAVKAKPVEEWFEPAAGRVKWGGLGAEIKEMDFRIRIILRGWRSEELIQSTCSLVPKKL